MHIDILNNSSEYTRIATHNSHYNCNSVVLSVYARMVTSNDAQSQSFIKVNSIMSQAIATINILLQSTFKMFNVKGTACIILYVSCRRYSKNHVSCA